MVLQSSRVICTQDATEKRDHISPPHSAPGSAERVSKTGQPASPPPRSGKYPRRWRTYALGGPIAVQRPEGRAEGGRKVRHKRSVQDSRLREPNFGYHVNASGRSTSRPFAFTDHVPIPAGSPIHAACTGSIPGLLSVDMHAPVSSLYYTHAPQLHPTRYIFHTQYSPPDLAKVHGTTRLLPISWRPGRVLKGISFKGFRNKSLLSNPFLQQFRNLAFSLITTRHLPVTSGKDRLAIPHSVSYEEF